MSVYSCRRCNYEQTELWEGACPRCGGFYRARKYGADSGDQKGRSTFAAAEKVKTLYIPTGIEGFDNVIGGGLVAGSPILLGGFRGAGKTTMLCMVCDAIANVKGSALYASSEEGVDGVVRVAKRLGLTNDKVEVLGGQSSVDRVIEHIERTKPFLTVFDSLQKYVSDKSGGAPGSLTQEKAVTEAIRDYCVRTKRCAIVVNQMVKSGEMKGGTDAAHAVDTVLVLAYPKDDDEDAPDDKGVRVLLCDGKNRNGPDNTKSYWKMHGENDPRPGYLECIPARSLLVETAPSRGKYGRR